MSTIGIGKSELGMGMGKWDGNWDAKIGADRDGVAPGLVGGGSERLGGNAMYPNVQVKGFAKACSGRVLSSESKRHFLLHF
jgi:hypothetical protein